jgi:tetratricopeptide (TPR) repeat protein
VTFDPISPDEMGQLCPANGGSTAMLSIDDRYDEAIALQQEGKFDEAVAKLEQLVADAPDYALAHAGLSAFYSTLGRHDEAVEHGRKVCELDADDPFSFMAMSLICQRAGLTAEAEEAMGRAMEMQWAARRDG